MGVEEARKFLRQQLISRNYIFDSVIKSDHPNLPIIRFADYQFLIDGHAQEPYVVMPEVQEAPL